LRRWSSLDIWYVETQDGSTRVTNMVESHATGARDAICHVRNHGVSKNAHRIHTTGRGRDGWCNSLWSAQRALVQNFLVRRMKNTFMQERTDPLHE